MPDEGSGAVTIRLPRALLQYWSGPSTVEVERGTLAQAFEGLERRAPGLATRLVDEQGQIRRHVAVFVNDTMVDGRDPAAVTLRAGDRVFIAPAVSGG
ncbi:MAG TPA: MoaD/ThiS family protein [Candidatus Thermoplasmatota archaeon]|nr:MoaD/ThiS family protein [Candidatus Thermoplasmatota archaeon]